MSCRTDWVWSTTIDLQAVNWVTVLIGANKTVTSSDASPHVVTPITVASYYKLAMDLPNARKRNKHNSLKTIFSYRRAHLFTSK